MQRVEGRPADGWAGSVVQQDGSEGVQEGEHYDLCPACSDAPYQRWQEKARAADALPDRAVANQLA